VVVTASVVAGTAALAAGVTALVAGPGKGTTRPQAAGSGHRQAATGKPVVHPAPALHVVSVKPEPGAEGVNGTKPITVRFSAALAPDSPLPKLSPSVAGTWKRDGDTATFTPSSGFFGGTTVTVHIRGGKSGVLSSAGEKRGAGGRLRSSVTHSFTTAPFSTLRLEQLLAQLGYLPLTWSPAGTPVQPSDTAAEVAAAYHPPPGSFSWQGGYPPALHSLWQPGSANLVDTGAIRAFESQNDLTMDGVAGPAVWEALLHDVAANQRNTNGYTYAYASKATPETLTIWHDGHQVLQSPGNTGIAKSPTADGTYPVYEKLRYQVMKGRNPNGSKYSDPVYWVSYFNGGDAVHYYNRGSYGSPQSLGCVELPYDAAKTSYRYLTYGSLVTVH
jgi:peptidoglycan hydrolase-like protein with peptidoglycan-binding domain